LREGALGPPTPVPWGWRPPRKDKAPATRDGRPVAAGGAFSGLAELLG
jgi:hypothetical protein